MSLDELETMQKEFKNFTPKQVIFYIENLSLMLLWGDNIDSDITNLSNYFGDDSNLCKFLKKLYSFLKIKKLILLLKVFKIIFI